jgi:hypothetical protein
MRRHCHLATLLTNDVGMNGEWMVLYNYGYDVNSIAAGFGLLPSPQLELFNFTVGGGKSFCFNATETITASWNEISFSVQSWGRVTLISGGNIRFLPGTVVHWGGSLSGLITTTSLYCSTYSPPYAPEQSVSIENNHATIRQP